MTDLLLLASPIFIGWLVFLPLEAWYGIDSDVRWNHPLSSGDARRFRAPPCEALEDLSCFEWTWDNLKAATGGEECSYSAKSASSKEEMTCQ